jgi:hypothetical protein
VRDSSVAQARNAGEICGVTMAILPSCPLPPAHHSDSVTKICNKRNTATTLSKSKIELTSTFNNVTAIAMKLRQKQELAKKIQREAKKAMERAQKVLEQRAKDAAAAVDVDICKPETWTSMVKDHNIQTDLSYFNYFKMALGRQQVNVEHMIQIHNESEDVHGHCPHFLKTPFPKQNVYVQFVVLLPGHSQSNQSRRWWRKKRQMKKQGKTKTTT